MTRAIIPLTDFRSLKHLIAEPRAGEPYPRGRFLPLQLADGVFLMNARLLARSDPYSPATLYQGVDTMASLYDRDSPLLVKNALTPEWRAALIANNKQMIALFEKQQTNRGNSRVDRRLALGNDDAAIGALQRILHVAGSVDMRDVFGRLTKTMGTFKGRYKALATVSGLLQNASLRTRLSTLGVTDDDMKEMDSLRQLLVEDFSKRSRSKVNLADGAESLRVVKGLLLGEVLLLGRLARGVLPKDRAVLYQVARLLGIARRKPGKAPTTPGPATPGTTTPGTPAPTTGHPGTSQGTGHTVHHGHTGHHGGHPAPAGGAVPTAPGTLGPTPTTPGTLGPTPTTPATTGTTAAGPAPATPAGTTPGTTASGTPATPTPAGPAPVTTPVVPAGVPAIAPGTVLAVLPVAGGPPLHAVMQADGKAAWVPAVPQVIDTTPAPTPARHPRHHGRGSRSKATAGKSGGLLPPARRKG